MKIPNENPMPGDILFVASKGFVGKLIKIRQAGIKAFSEDLFIPTHVGLVISNAGLIIESTMENGVEVHGIHKYIDNKKYENRVLVMRNINFENKISGNEKLLEKYSDMFTNNWQEKYNFSAWAKIQKEGKKFCSELAFDCLKKASIISSNLNAAKVYPYDLLKIIFANNDWRDVDIAAMLSLSRTKINRFFDEQIQKHQITLGKIQSISKELKNMNEKGKEIGKSNEIPDEIRDKLNIILDTVSQLLPLSEKFGPSTFTIAQLEEMRNIELKNEEDARKKYESLIEVEQKWLLLNSIDKK